MESIPASGNMIGERLVDNIEDSNVIVNILLSLRDSLEQESDIDGNFPKKAKSEDGKLSCADGF